MSYNTITSTPANDSERKPITEEGFIKEPLGKEYYDYARYSVGGLLKRVSSIWRPGNSEMILDDFVMEIVLCAIDYTKKDYAKGLFRKEKTDSFKKFFWWRIKKAFFTKLEELGKVQNQASFDERLGKYYEEGTAECGPTGEVDDYTVIGSAEKEKIIEENREIKMRYVKEILDAVSELPENQQRLFFLKFKINFSEEDTKMWDTIKSGKHVKDPFTRMANQKFGISENYAKKKISEIKTYLIAKLNEAGRTSSCYRQNTSMPGMLQSLFATSPRPQLNLDIENLSEDDCQDILVELFF